jgi:hypothetical protein
LNKGKNFFSIGFKNDKGGWELRNSQFKGCVSPKAITTIEGKDGALNIFEGFFDFLSCLSFYRTSTLNNRTIILNSVNNFHWIEEMVKNEAKVNLFLDNDNAGEKLANHIQQLNPNTNNISQSLYSEYKDFNDFIMRKKKNESNNS